MLLVYGHWMLVPLLLNLCHSIFQTIIDMTYGAGGHSKKILDHAADLKLVAVDRDPVAHKMSCLMAQERKG